MHYISEIEAPPGTPGPVPYDPDKTLFVAAVVRASPGARSIRYAEFYEEPEAALYDGLRQLENLSLDMQQFLANGQVPAEDIAVVEAEVALQKATVTFGMDWLKRRPADPCWISCPAGNGWIVCTFVERPDTSHVD